MSADTTVNDNGQTEFPAPLQASGALDKYEHEDITPVIGREYPHLNVVNDLLDSPDGDELIRDLAIASNMTFFLTIQTIS